MFFHYAEYNIPKHLDAFLTEYHINDWRKYIKHLHDIIKIASEDSDQSVLSNIIVESTDENYDFKNNFL